MTMPRYILSDPLEPRFPHRSRGVAWPPLGRSRMGQPLWGPTGALLSSSRGLPVVWGLLAGALWVPPSGPLSWQVANGSSRLIKLLSSRCAGWISEHLAAKRDRRQPPAPTLVLRSSRNAAEYRPPGLDIFCTLGSPLVVTCLTS